jgi:CheY-like chemotaxis protein/DNA-directed RNA polymerase specialized sigma24 family protein
MQSPAREQLIRALPYARRYARALSGSQARGDALVADALKDWMAAEQARDATVHAERTETSPRSELYYLVTRRFDREQESAGDQRQSGLPRLQRQLLLLTSLEEMAVDEAAGVVGVDAEGAADMLGDARARLRDAAATDVLIIEDEPIIAMDLEELVQTCGHRVVGVASTEEDAVTTAKKTQPGLILADINLGSGGTGTSAVARILRDHHVPVIFVTAYPERLLTGEALEPAFIITKPFDPMTLAIATYQAVTGGVPLD